MKVPPYTFPSVLAIFIPSMYEWENKKTAIITDINSAAISSRNHTFLKDRVSR